MSSIFIIDDSNEDGYMVYSLCAAFTEYTKLRKALIKSRRTRDMSIEPNSNYDFTSERLHSAVLSYHVRNWVELIYSRGFSGTKWARLFFPSGCCPCMKQYSHKSELILYFVFIICYVHITEVTACCPHLFYPKIFYSSFHGFFKNRDHGTSAFSRVQYILTSFILLRKGREHFD